MASAEECLLAVIQNDEAALMGSEPDQGRLVIRRRFNDPDLRVGSQLLGDDGESPKSESSLEFKYEQCLIVLATWPTSKNAVTFAPIEPLPSTLSIMMRSSSTGKDELTSGKDG